MKRTSFPALNVPKRRDPPTAPAGVSALPEGGELGASSVLRKRLEAACAARRMAPPQVIRAEWVSLLAVDLPVRGTRQRRAALPFALEDRIAAPLDRVHVALGPVAPLPDAPQRVLAAVVALGVMVDAGGDGAVLPETLAVPRPLGDAAWAVWRRGGRCVVRAADGTGFGMATAMLAPLWARAGRPTLTSFGEPLPDDLPADDLSADPPPVDPADLAFDLAQGAFTRGGTDWARTAAVVGWAIGLAALAHLGLMTADRFALSRIAAAERAAAQAALAPILPGVSVTSDPAPVLARLAPVAPAQKRSAFLPLLSRVSAVMAAQPGPLGVRRLSFAAPEAQLSLLVEAGDLAGLQALEQALGAAGFLVAGGAATASDGGAQTEFRIRDGAGG